MGALTFDSVEFFLFRLLAAMWHFTLKEIRVPNWNDPNDKGKSTVTLPLCTLCYSAVF